MWASLVAHCQRIRLTMQETQVQSLIWKSPTCYTAKPVCHHHWAWALESQLQLLRFMSQAPTTATTTEAQVPEELKPPHFVKKRLHFRVLRKESLEIPWPHPTTCEPIRSQIRISWLYVQDLWPAREIWIKPGKWESIRTRGQPGKWKPIRTQHLTLPQKVTN